MLHACKFPGVQLASAMKVNAGICALATDLDLESGFSKSMSVGTQKMPNNVRDGQNQVKLWWRFVAILTCKSFVILGYRGERLTNHLAAGSLRSFTEYGWT